MTSVTYSVDVINVNLRMLYYDKKDFCTTEYMFILETLLV